MKPVPFSLFLPARCLLAVALSSAFAAPAFAAAGTAQFTAGDVKVKRVDGALSVLSKGLEIDSGQSVLTGADGRAQVRFTDGGLISLQPNTEFKIANYVDKLDAKEDRFLVDLLRGSMRAITGLIGKRNRDNYRVNTATATIGIRGSGFNVGYNPDGTLSVTTELDAIEVCTAGGCVGLTAGESVKVLNNTQAPVRTNVRVTVTTPPPVQEALISAQQAAVLAQIKLPSVAVPTGSVVSDMRIDSYAGNSVNNFVSTFSQPVGFNDPLIASFNSSGNLQSFETATARYTPDPGAVITSGNLGAPGDPDFIGWGNWSPTSARDKVNDSVLSPYNVFGYVIGRPTGTANLPPGLISASYVVAGATQPITTSTTSGVIGFPTFFNASLNINFSTNIVDFDVATSAGGFSTLSNQGTPILLTPNRTFSGVQSGGTFQGFTIGPTANRAGVTYVIYNNNTTTTGAIAFSQGGGN